MEHPKAVRQEFGQRQQAVKEAFRQHKERIRPLLPPALQQLQDQYIHDAWIQSLYIDPPQKTLRLCLGCCDTPGCFNITLHYKEIQLTEQETSLLCLIAHEESAEIYWGEVDIKEGASGSPVFIHRILWNTNITTWPTRIEGKAYVNSILTPEMELRFGDFEIEVTPHPEKEWPRPPEFITVVRDVEKRSGTILPSAAPSSL